MHKLVFISTYIYSVKWWFVISFVCRVFGALRQAHWLHQQIWGFRSTFWAFPELSSPSRCLWRLSSAVLRMSFAQSGIPVIDQEPDFGLNFWAIGWELFKTVRNPLHKWPHLPLTMGNFHNFWMNLEKSFPEQTWFFQILMLVIF